MKNSAKMTIVYITMSDGAKRKKLWFRPLSKYHYKAITIIMLPLRYGSVLTNIILITVLRLSMDPMVWVSSEWF